MNNAFYTTAAVPAANARVGRAVQKFVSYLLIALMALSGSFSIPIASPYTTVNVTQTIGGTISADVETAEPGDTVTGTISAENGYDIATVRVETGSGYFLADINESGTAFSFKMPADAKGVNIAAHYMSTTVWDGSVDVSWYDPSASEYSIGTPAELAGLAALVNGRVDADTPSYMIKGNASYIKSKANANVMLVGAGGGNVSDTVYTSDVDFAYKTVRLTADLDMGGVYTGGKWSGPNYTPVGGKFSMDTDMVNGDSYVIDTRFNGVFDGQGHTVNNIYCQRYSDKGFPYSMAVGLVGFLGGKSDISGGTSDFKDGWQPAVRNVVVGEGYIRGRRMVGGVVGRVGATNNGIIIENCANRASVSNTDAKGVGGILGSASGKGVIRNCYNTGTISTTYSCPAGGIVGANSGVDVYNCYNVGKIDSNGAHKGRGIGGHDSGSYTVNNCYTLPDCDDDADSKGYYKGSSRKIEVNVAQVSAAQLKSSSILASLNANGNIFTTEGGKNSGYPILYFEAAGYSAGAGNFKITVTQSSGGTISADCDGTASPGKVINLKAVPDAGYKLECFTVNGTKINGSFFTASGDANVAGVFKQIKTVKLSVPSNNDYSLVVTATGYIVENGVMKNVKNHPVYNGASIMEDTVLFARAAVYSDATPSDKSKEYTGTFTYAASNTTTLSLGKFKVDGSGDISLTVTPQVRETSWISAGNTKWYEAKKVKYTINTYQELAGLASLVNEQKLSFEGKTIELGSDISLAEGDRVWTPIGSSASSPFKGTFDGKGHVIGALRSDSGTKSYSGLFGFCSGATIKNLTVRGTSSSSAGMSYAGGIASYAQGGSFENCVNRVAVTAAGDYAGGIVSYTVGGVKITGCHNYAEITGKTGVGGIAGVCESAEDKIENCVNIGAVSSKGTGLSGTGGIVGKLTGTAAGCINAGAVSGSDRYVGGIAGYTNGRKTSAIENCQNAGQITSVSSAEQSGLGGVVGFAQFGTYNNCSNTGKVTAGAGYKSGNTGGIIGRTGNEPALSAASDCVYETSSASSAAAGGSYEGIAAQTGVPAAAYTEIADPGDPAAGAGTSGSAGAARVSEICGGITLASGSYYLMNHAAGQLDIAPGANVTLIGTDRMLGALTVKVGDGASLTLRDVKYTGDDILLQFSGRGNLVLAGNSSIIGLSDEGENKVPTVYAAGDLAISGTGALYLESGRGNAAMKIASGKTLTVNSGLLSIYKAGLLGSEGGALFANGATVNIRGGSVEGRTDSDNVSVISATSVNISGGSVNLRAEKSPKAIDASKVNVTGGTLRARGNSGNSASVKKAYYSAQSIPNLVGNAKFYSETGAYKTVKATTQKITVDGVAVDMEVYNIDGNNYFKLRDMAALMAGTKSEFSVDFNGDMKSMYTIKGEKYKSAGGELLTGTDKSSKCSPSSWVLFVNGNLVSCKVYNIGGNNFFKLRDMSSAFGFTADYNANTRTVIIKS